MINFLVVEDSSTIRNFIRAALRMMGSVNVHAVADGDEAIALLGQEEIDFILCDWNMPKMSGLEVLKAVRANEAWRDIPFVMLTANLDRESVAQAKAAGVSGYIGKPVRHDQLITKVRQVLAQ